MKVINSLTESSTLIVVAHRLLTTRNAYPILCVGMRAHTHAESFYKLPNKFSEFKKQANLLGL